MKKLLSLALMLVGLTAFGQSHKNNTFTTNAYPATISFPSFDTNTVVLSGFSVAALNGNYVWTVSSGLHRWLKAANNFAMYYDPDIDFVLLTNATGDLQIVSGAPESFFVFGDYFPHIWEDGGAGGTMGIGNWLATTRNATLVAVTNGVEFFQVCTLLASNMNVGVGNILTNMSPGPNAGGNMLGAWVSGYGNTVTMDQAAIAGGNGNYVGQRQGFIGGGNTSFLVPKPFGSSADSAFVGSEISWMNADASFVGGALFTTNTSHRNTAIIGSWKSTLSGGPNAFQSSGSQGFGSAMAGVYESFAILHSGSLVSGKWSTNIANGDSYFSFGEGNQISNINHSRIFGDHNKATIAANHGVSVLGSGHFLDKANRTYLGNTNGVWIDPSGFVSLWGVTNRGAAGTAVTTWTTGSDTPEGAVVASIGSLYSRVNGGAATTLYVKESGTGNTGWVAVGSGGDSLWQISDDTIIPVPANAVHEIGTTVTDPANFIVKSALDLVLQASGEDTHVTFGGNLANFASAVRITPLGGSGNILSFVDNDGDVERWVSGEAVSATGTLSIGGGTVTASTPVLNLSQTWNQGATTFTGLKLNVTDTTSAAASMLVDLQLGGASQFAVTKAGQVTAGNYFGKASNDLIIRAPSGNSLQLDGAGGGTGKSVTFNGTKLILGNGTAAINAAAGGNLKVDTTTTGNVGGGEDNLISYTIPANTLPNNGNCVEFEMWGTFAANANTKQLKIVYGSTTLLDSTGIVFNGRSWRVVGTIARTGAATQTATCQMTVSGTLLGTETTATTSTTSPTETLSGALAIKATATVSGAGTDDNSIVQNGLVVKYYPTGN